MTMKETILAIACIFWQVCGVAHDVGTIEWIGYKLLSFIAICSLFIIHTIRTKE